jgi:hypothetical protein
VFNALAPISVALGVSLDVKSPGHLSTTANLPFLWRTFSSIRLELIEGQADAEAGVAGLGADADVAAMLADDAHGVVEA